MKVIEELAEFIGEEIGDAEKYAKRALKYKEEYPDLSKAFHALSNEEMQHKRILHDHVVKIIEDYRKKNGEPPASMMAVYDYLHERHIGEAAKVKAMQDQY